MQVVTPKRFSHCPRRAYTLRGFEQKVIKNQMQRLGITRKEAEKLKRLYFPRGLTAHLDKSGAYRNLRKYHLYNLGRQLGKDRKSRLFELIERSEMFYIYYDDDGSVAAVVSPWVHRYLGIIPIERLISN